MAGQARAAYAWLSLLLAIVCVAAPATDLLHSGARAHDCALCHVAHSAPLVAEAAAVPLPGETGQNPDTSASRDLPAEPLLGFSHSRAPPA